eukprot:gene3938-14014_t
MTFPHVVVGFTLNVTSLPCWSLNTRDIAASCLILEGACRDARCKLSGSVYEQDAEQFLIHETRLLFAPLGAADPSRRARGAHRGAHPPDLLTVYDLWFMTSGSQRNLKATVSHGSGTLILLHIQRVSRTTARRQRVGSPIPRVRVLECSMAGRDQPQQMVVPKEEAPLRVGPEVIISVVVRDQQASEVTFKVKTTTKWRIVTDAYAEYKALDRCTINFIFNCQRLSDFMTIGDMVADLAFQDGDIVNCVLQQLNIGQFGPHLSSPGAALLSSSSAALGGSREEVVCVVEKVRRESVRGKPRGGAGGRCDSVWEGQQEPQWHGPSQCLPSEQQRLALISVLDEHWKTQQQQQQEDHYHEAGTSVRVALLASSPVTPFADFKVELSRSELESLVGVESVARLVSLFGGRVDQIKLRRVSAGSHGAGHGGEQDGRLDACCIPFHLDEAELTMQLIPLPPAPCPVPQLIPPCPLPRLTHPCPVPQVALNSPDDYTGGDLVFLLPDTASALVPSRSPGSTTVHDNSVVHGVTRMQAGVRYSLFLMQLLDMQVGGEGAAAAS